MEAQGLPAPAWRCRFAVAATAWIGAALLRPASSRRRMTSMVALNDVNGCVI